MDVHRTTDTIAAIATPPGSGGIGIVRVSGPLAARILGELFTPRKRHSRLESHKFYHGLIADHGGRVLDEVLAVHMRAPATYTREDVVEIHCHGSHLVVQAILQAVLESGARPADPGEFTKRAFLAGRIDLTQAEAVIDLLQAPTLEGVQLAVNQLQGGLFDELEKVRKALVNILAVLEVAIDFPDDDVEIIDSGQLAGDLRAGAIEPIERLIHLAEQGKIIREGVKVVIAGCPNVGKSSLLNGLLREERALVTAIPGTTRDTIEEMISIRGLPIHLVDTAGIRAHDDLVEELGIERTRRKLREADLVLFLVDATAPLSERDLELYATIRDKEHLVLLNKQDIAEREHLDRLQHRFADVGPIAISAREGQGLEELQEAMYRLIIGDGGLRELGACAPNVRHRAVLEKTLNGCLRLEEAFRSSVPSDLLAVELQVALDHLGDIVGLTTTEDVLDVIFSEFCIGK